MTKVERLRAFYHASGFLVFGSSCPFEAGPISLDLFSADARDFLGQISDLWQVLGYANTNDTKRQLLACSRKRKTLSGWLYYRIAGELRYGA